MILNTKVVSCEKEKIKFNCTNCDSIKRKESKNFRLSIYRLLVCVWISWWGCCGGGRVDYLCTSWSDMMHMSTSEVIFYIRASTLKYVTSYRSLIMSIMQEQLLEEQQQEIEILRLAKLREIEKKKKLSERQFRGKNLREHSIFYTTCVLAFFSVSAGSSILFLVPLYVGEYEILKFSWAFEILQYILVNF